MPKADLSPGPLLDCARVLSYAVVDDSVIYKERGILFVAGKLLGPVPRLALCQYLDESEIMVIFCDNEWNSLAATSYETIEGAKCELERSYHGLLNKWVDTQTTESEARELLEQEFANEKCSFCGKWPMDVSSMIGEEVRICNYCIDEFYKWIHEDEKA